jgi:hypothetical protein
MWFRAVAVGSAVCLAALGVAGCGDDDDGADVKVSLSEFIVTPEPASIESGSRTIEADNVGGETHELVIAKADSTSDLPTDEDGAVDEEGFEAAGVELVDEAEDIAADDSKELTVDLEPGTYVLFCNIVEEEEGETVSHFAEGMVNTLRVT